MGQFETPAGQAPGYNSPVPASRHINTQPVQQQRQGADGAVYVRSQKGHSIILHVLFGWIVLWIPTIYFSVSPNHYWHA